MMYKVTYSNRASKQIKKMDKNTQKKIMDWIYKNLENCENPRAKGKALVANFSGYWRYRVEDYRILCEIHDQELIIYTVSVMHRKEAYKKTSP